MLKLFYQRNILLYTYNGTISICFCETHNFKSQETRSPSTRRVTFFGNFQKRHRATSLRQNNPQNPHKKPEHPKDLRPQPQRTIEKQDKPSRKQRDHGVCGGRSAAGGAALAGGLAAKVEVLRPHQGPRGRYLRSRPRASQAEASGSDDEDIVQRSKRKTQSRGGTPQPTTTVRSHVAHADCTGQFISLTIGIEGFLIGFDGVVFFF